MIASMNYKERLGIVMELKVGDVVVFKNYEDLSLEENLFVPKDKFPKFGKVESVAEPIGDVVYFTIEGSSYIFKTPSVARVIIDTNDVHYSNSSDEELINTVVKVVFDRFAQVESSIDKTEAAKILERQVPEHFIVKENYYGMYIGGGLELVSDKSKAKIYTLRDTADDDAADMRLDDYSVIPYDD